MINVFIDFETYYDKDCTLKKQSTIEYVMDSRSKTLGVSVAIDLDTARFLSEEEFLTWSKAVPWHNAMVIAHNCKFDAMILTQRYKIKPARYCCTQSMANATLEVKSKSLASVANFLSLGEKGNALVEGSSEVTDALRVYANNDLALCRRIYYRLVPYLPSQELDLISLTVRMAVEPWLILNGPLLEQVRNEEIRRRSDAIKASGFAESQLTSNPQFAAILRTHRITVPTKTSNATGLETEAFSKGDEEFVSLMLEYPQYKHLWEGRLAAKSNINIRRPEKLLNIVDCNGGLLPVTYTYYGAHTGRYSGTDGINLQNLPHKSKSRLRECIRAPKGYQIGVVDSSQIELRLNMWFTDQMDKVELLRKGGDIYRTEAAKQFGISEAEVTKDQRQFGKVVQLGCGYGMGASKFRRYCAAGPLGLDPIILTADQAFDAINVYRKAHPKVTETWTDLDKILWKMWKPKCEKYTYKFIHFHHEVVQLPNGMLLQYPKLGPSEDGDAIVYQGAKEKLPIWGGLLCQNIVQALARIVNMYQMLEIDKQFRVVGTTHDEVWFLVPNGAEKEAEEYALKCMSTPPDWAPDLPVSAEFIIAEHYCK